MKKRRVHTALAKEESVLSKHWKQYRGNIVMVIDDRIYATKKGSEVQSKVKQIEKKYHRRPLITYIPREGTLILLF